MGAYPLYRAPTIGQFAESLRSHGVSLKTDVSKHVRPGARLLYLERQVDGRTLRAFVDPENEKALLEPNVIRSLCNVLGIPPECVPGFELG